MSLPLFTLHYYVISTFILKNNIISTQLFRKRGHESRAEDLTETSPKQAAPIYYLRHLSSHVAYKYHCYN